MKKVVIDVTVNDILEYLCEPWCGYVYPLMMKESEWKERVINSYPQPELLRRFWDSVMRLFIRHIIGNSHYHISRKHYAKPLIRRIDSVATARTAFERFIKPDTITGRAVMKNYNFCRMVEYQLGMGDPLNLDGKPVKFNRYGKRIDH